MLKYSGFTNQKNYINHSTQERECGICHEIKPFKDFSPIRVGKPHSYCKKCRSKQNFMKMMEKKATLYPGSYVQCLNDDCNHIWSISKGMFCAHCKCEGETVW